MGCSAACAGKSEKKSTFVNLALLDQDFSEIEENGTAVFLDPTDGRANNLDIGDTNNGLRYSIASALYESIYYLG